MRAGRLRQRWFVVGVVLVVAILGCGTGGASADEPGGSASDGEATQVVSASDDDVRHSRPQNVAELGRLTVREAQVVLAIADGDTTTKVAEELGITARTVESHLLNAYGKLGVHSRVQLMRFLARAGHLRL